MKILILFISFVNLILAFTLNDTEDCRNTDQACPVWNGWSDPKCHQDNQPSECRRIPDASPPQWICYKWACTYCAAKAFGCSTDLIGGVEAGKVVSFETRDSYNCGNPEIPSPSTFKIHCACGGACSFHGNYKIYYTTIWPPKSSVLVEQFTQEPKVEQSKE